MRHHRLSPLVSLEVQGEVIAPGEGSLALLTPEGPGPRVLPDMTGQLIRSSNDEIFVKTKINN